MAMSMRLAASSSLAASAAPRRTASSSTAHANRRLSRSRARTAPTLLLGGELGSDDAVIEEEESRETDIRTSASTLARCLALSNARPATTSEATTSRPPRYLASKEAMSCKAVAAWPSLLSCRRRRRRRARPPKTPHVARDAQPQRLSQRVCQASASVGGISRTSSWSPARTVPVASTRRDPAGSKKSTAAIAPRPKKTTCSVARVRRVTRSKGSPRRTRVQKAACFGAHATYIARQLASPSATVDAVDASTNDGTRARTPTPSIVPRDASYASHDNNADDSAPRKINTKSTTTTPDDPRHLLPWERSPRAKTISTCATYAQSTHVHVNRATLNVDAGHTRSSPATRHRRPHATRPGMLGWSSHSNTPTTSKVGGDPQPAPRHLRRSVFVLCGGRDAGF
mmetsp:Transcript_33528/g.107101  ORF Transcript_33528/g.107101 Transcript_33528/m.107101 type:complete len:399 (+) Transcript_33528:2126-3322(+)